MTPEEQRLVAELTKHPAWEVLNKTAKERMEMSFRVLATSLMTKGAKIDQGQIDYERGFFAGMKHLLRKPELAAADIAKALAEREEVTLGA